MPYTIGNPPDRIKKLPKHAQRIWISAYNSAYEDYDPKTARAESREAYANSVAWAAVKRDYKKVGGKWVKKAVQPHGPHKCICPECGAAKTVEADVECRTVECPKCGAKMRGTGEGERRGEKMKYLSMAISKLVKRNGIMHFETTVSDNDWDKQDERLTIELFHDFIAREDMKKSEQADEYLPPFLSISHYERRAGDVSEMWVQGNRFKTRGIFYDDKFGRALFKALVEERQDEDVENPIKLSIAFWPFGTREEEGKVAYIKGEFHHEAATRVPINERTSFDEVTEKSMAITKKEDATSIVGGDLAEELDVEERSRKEKGDLEEGLVIKAEEDSPLTELQELELKALLEEEGEDEEVIEKAVWSYQYKRSLPNSAYLWVERGAKCKKKDGKTPQKCRHLPYKDKSGKVECGHLRAAIQAIGGARTGKPMSVPKGTVEKAKRLYARHCKKGKALVDIPEAEMVYRPYGGATSIADAVSYMEGQEAAWKLQEDVHLFKNIVDNILKSEDIDNKKAAISKAVSELNTLLEADMEKEEKMKEKKEKDTSVLSILEGIKESPAAETDDKGDAAPEKDTSLDALLGAYKSIVYSEDLDRGQKIAGGSQCLKLLAAAGDRIISETTPRSAEDFMAEIVAAVDEKVAERITPLAEKVAVLEAQRKAGLREEPVRKGITVVEKAPAEGEPIKKGSLAWYARQMSGLDPETGKAIF